jgi:predicted metal-dependent HD superfamily phosphohydrolase
MGVAVDPPSDAADPSMAAGPEADGPLLLPAEMLDALRMAYAAPARAYHHFGHVRDVVPHYRAVAAAVADGSGWHRPAEVWLALLYHDAVYVPGRRDNEARSAELAKAHIAHWLPQAGIDAARVSTLILATARHGAIAREDTGDDADGEDLRRFLDCDMAILGAAPEVFAAYDRAIAEEYRAVPRWLYRRRRRAFLRGLLEAPRIYLSDFFHARLDAQARRNLNAALAAPPAGR